MDKSDRYTESETESPTVNKIIDDSELAYQVRKTFDKDSAEQMIQELKDGLKGFKFMDTRV